MTSKVHIHASELAALIGDHPYVKRHEAFEKLWRRSHPISYHEALQRNDLHTHDEIVDAIACKDPVVKKHLDEASKELRDTSTGAAMSVATHAACIPDSLNASEKKIIAKELKTRISTQYGITHEKPVLEILKKEFGYDVVPGDGRYYKLDTGNNVIIGGKIDAITEDGKLVIEIKNRMNRLFMQPTTYETIQVQCYVHLIPTAERALLVEALANDTTTSINIIPIAKDDVAWSLYIEKAHAVARVLEVMVSCPDIQGAYFQSSRRSSFLQKVHDRHPRTIAHPLQ